MKNFATLTTQAAIAKLTLRIIVLGVQPEAATILVMTAIHWGLAR
jgi:hypothetical protein